ncbi:IQ domain-containing protein C isoform X2 [Ochotona princeps]|uniref:IQ domain-containing protein C isoform X2 n=1 Tax=Ochotona princeps TaxID=9978 RepID=UPI002714CA41|nr:IQ domain-containing protein C isoform X2 [Ochotona princeps]
MGVGGLGWNKTRKQVGPCPPGVPPRPAQRHPCQGVSCEIPWFGRSRSGGIGKHLAPLVVGVGRPATARTPGLTGIQRQLPWRQRPRPCACARAARTNDALRGLVQAGWAVGVLMEQEVLLRKVSLLQACVRGFLVRRQFQRLRAEYETIVGEIEGDLGPLQWTEGRMPRPKFLPQAEPSQKPKGRRPRDTLREETPEATGPGTPHGSPEFQELQCHRSHLAMELLWIQQAINSRKEYLILRQTLSAPEADRTGEQTRTCSNPGGQACGLMPSQPPEEQSCRVRIPREPSHMDDTCQRGGRSRGRRSSERPVTTDQNSIEAESTALCCMSAGPHSLARGHRLTKDPSQGGQALEGGCLQEGQILEEQTTGVLKPRATCSRKARIQLRELFEDPDMKDKCLQWLDPQDSDCQTGRSQALGLSEDPILWERTPAGPEHESMDVRRAKPAKSQTPRNGASTDPDGQGCSSQRTGLWCSRLPETLSPAGSSHTGENQWRDGQWKTGPAG